MTEAPPSPDDEHDDALAELLADKIVELACEPGLMRLAALQMAGLLPETDLDDVALARALGCTRRTVFNIRRSGLEKLACRPDVLELARSLQS